MADPRISFGGSVAAIVLAAGASRRLGQPKQLVEIEGEPLLRRITRLALEAGCSPVVVVLGAAEERCRAVLKDLPVAFAASLLVVVNPKWAEGMSTSLLAGLAALPVFPADATPAGGTDPAVLPLSPRQSTQADATLVLVSDQVRLTSGSLRQLLNAHRESPAAVTAARYGGRLGVPAIFSAELLPALAALSGDQGARRLLEVWSDRATAVDLPEAAFELDTPKELAALLQVERDED